ncbi:MAG: BREX-1 system adenine-specific DNA-methyltransferase PglX, partial [Ruminococcus sp.]
FAIYARNRLIEDIKNSLLQMGVTSKGLTSYDGHLSQSQRQTRSSFDSLIKSRGEEYSSAYDSTVEDVAYNWFTRIVALRYMDLNNIIPVEESIFPNSKGEEPPLLSDKDFSFLSLTQEEKEVLANYRKNGDEDSFYTFIFVKLSNYVSKILGIFPDDMEECNIPLFVLSYKNDGIITRLCSIDEDNFTNGVEIMGWFHQYYNTDVFNRLYDGDMSKKKIESKYLPVATQLYTPDWVVKYMVENTLGRTWIDHLLGIGQKEKANILLENWIYYIPDADEDSKELLEIRQKKGELTPQDITFIDPCMGSGHILVYAFEILMQIYISEGYSKEDAPLLILENNLFGLDIDDRACYLSRFALMMKAYQYDKNILNKTNEMNLFAVQESNSFLYLRETMDFFAQGNHRLLEEFEYLVSVFYNAKEYGSLLNLRKVDFPALDKRIKEVSALTPNNEQEELYKKEITEKFVPLVNQAKVMTNHYDIVVTNPPYLNSSRMSKNLSDYVNREYSIAKNDLASVFIQKATGVLTKDDGMVAMITTVSWMYLKSFERFRKYLLHTFQINSIVDFGTELFEGKIGHLPVVTWTSRKHLPFQKIHSVRLTDYNYSKRNEKQQQFFNAENHFYADQMDFAKIPGEPVAYWLGDSFIKAFEQGRTLGELSIV